MDPITVLTGLGVLGTGFGLLGAGVRALWKIAGGLGKFEAKTTTILEAMQVMLRDHEARLRAIERER